MTIIFFVACRYDLRYTYFTKHILKTFIRLALLVNVLVLSLLFIVLNWFFFYCIGLCFGTFYYKKRLFFTYLLVYIYTRIS